MRRLIFLVVLFIQCSHLNAALPNGYNTNSTFKIVDLMKRSVEGIVDCGKYCIVGGCGHFRAVLSWKGISLTTYISPKIRHSNPDLLVSSYPHVGSEPLYEWQKTIGAGAALINESVGTMFGLPDGMVGGISQFEQTGVNTRHKEVDIIGHPVAILSQILDNSGSGYSKTKLDNLTNVENLNDMQGNSMVFSASTITNADKSLSNESDEPWTVESLITGKITKIVNEFNSQFRTALKAYDIYEKVQSIVDYADKLNKLRDTVQTALDAVKLASYSSGIALINPTFVAPRVMCPSTVRALQPYYLSYLDALYWKLGWPITDGPLSSDHTATILNPFSGDKLTANVVLSTMTMGTEFYGHLYPREGTVNTGVDFKAGALTAWRAMDVLINDVPDNRVGVKLPAPGGRWKPSYYRWQMIYPRVGSCRTTPILKNSNFLIDGLSQSALDDTPHEAYAWNYYRRYQCCSYNGKGRYLGSFDLPTPVCVSSI